MSEARTAWGWGLASVDAAGTTLDVWYPELTLGEAPAESDRPNHNFGTLASWAKMPSRFRVFGLAMRMLIR